MSDVYQQSVELHQKYQGKLGVQSLVSVKNRDDLSLAYTPGVAEPCRVIAKDPDKSFELTMRGRTVAVISDGSAVLGLGNIGPEAAMPVMEGKSLLMKEFGGVDSIPLVIATQDTQEIIKFVKQVAPSFAGINLEDISAPRCFEVESALQDIGIPVFHDDQDGTAIVVTAALRNAAKVVGKKFEELSIVIVGAGAAGLATAKMLQSVGDVVVVDSKGALSLDRTDLNPYKRAFAEISNKQQKSGDLATVLQGADAVIGVSGPGIITKEMVSSMADQAIVMAMANPVPEIMPALAKEAGAMVVASGRSDFPNQINNVLAFPGIFRAVVEARLPRITKEMKFAAAEAIASCIPEPTADRIIPEPFFPDLSKIVAEAVKKVA
ncbi:MAG TPA: NADP-dependent malic enzyme [Vitreimonas sp.]|nr:NADP-dependent malic enzyme [Vitreimonas sp.]